MLVQGTQGNKSLGTLGAGEWSLPGVGSLVNLQLRLRPKEAAALMALEPLVGRCFVIF